MCDNIRSDGDWFFSAGDCNLKTQSSLQSSLASVNGSHANYLLDLTPDPAGHIPDCQAQLLAKLKP